MSWICYDFRSADPALAGDGYRATATVSQETKMGPFGFQELLIIFLIIVVIFGASKIPQLGRGLGEGIRNFKRGLKGDEPGELEEGKTSSPSK